MLILTDGAYPGPVTIDRPLTVAGPQAALVDGTGTGTVITISAPDVVLTGFTVTGSGTVNETLDAGIKILKGADRARVEGLALIDNISAWATVNTG